MTDETKRMLDEGREFDAQARKALVGHVLGECGDTLTSKDLEELADFLLCDDLVGGIRAQHVAGRDYTMFSADQDKTRKRVRRVRHKGDVEYIDNLEK